MCIYNADWSALRIVWKVSRYYNAWYFHFWNAYIITLTYILSKLGIWHMHTHACLRQHRNYVWVLKCQISLNPKMIFNIKFFYIIKSNVHMVFIFHLVSVCNVRNYIGWKMMVFLRQQKTVKLRRYWKSLTPLLQITYLSHLK